MPYKDPQKQKEYWREYGRRPEVREKNKLRSRNFRKNHPETARATKKKYYLNGGYQIQEIWKKDNPDKIRRYKQKWGRNNRVKKANNYRLWKLNNPDKVKAYNLKNRDKTNERARLWRSKIQNKISHAICGQIYEAIKEKKDGRCWESLVNYTLKDLIIHLESRFDINMKWGNYGSYWNIDHVIPKSWFDFKSTEDEDFKKCWALDNLQPMINKENWIKNNNFSGTVRNPIYRGNFNGQKT